MRHTFGGDLAAYTIALGADQVQSATGITGYPAIVVGGERVTFWNTQTGGTQYVDLLAATTGGPDDEGGEQITSVVTSSGTNGEMPLGCIPMFLGPEDITVMWAQVGEGSGGTITGADDESTDDTGEGTTGDGETEDDTGDTGDTGDVSADPVNGDGGVNLRMMIVASTAGLALADELHDFRSDIEPRVESLEASQQVQDLHLHTHDDQIAELQSRSGSGGALVTGHTAQRGTASVGAMFLDIDTNQIWVGIVTADNSGAVWAPLPGTVVFKARQTTSQSLDDQSTQPMAMQAIDLDLYAAFNPASPTRFIPKAPGFYLLQGTVGFSANNAANPGSMRYTQWRINGQPLTGGTTANASSQGYSVVANTRSVSVYCNGTSDRIELCAYHNAATAITTTVTSWGQAQMNITYQGGSGGEP